MRVLARDYRCTADSSHATIKRQDLEWRAITELFAAFVGEAEDEVQANAPLAALAARIRELEAERSRWTAVAARPGADLAAVGKELARIGRDVEEAQSALTQARVSDAHADLLEMVRATVADVQRVSVEATERPLKVTLEMTPWFDFFNGLELDARRDLIASKLLLTVSKGRGQSRVSVEPRVTT